MKRLLLSLLLGVCFSAAFADTDLTTCTNEDGSFKSMNLDQLQHAISRNRTYIGDIREKLKLGQIDTNETRGMLWKFEVVNMGCESLLDKIIFENNLERYQYPRR